ncbi:TIGR03943 family protein [Lentzea albidocapillata subsp. violacea]|uniref:TIGR03943 family protein n=1 Tax=Lentzea albidocapillata subsp. violacea TaxID=128104 RepID=A0A1G9APN0_9PSEU|nr:TIGR03943 family protein [Lentzea albidocapillata]SDK28540.1 TIGR03943 family protein [Lentzea albidocapillata subsp. violacea]
MRRETQNILLVLLGGALLKISFSGLYLRYVQKSLLPLLIAAGVIMIGLALFAIVQDIRRGKAASDADHEHSHSSRSTWLMLLPVLAVFLISPPALGGDVVNSAADTNQAQRSRNLLGELPSGDVIPLSMTEFVTRTAWDESGTLDGRRVKLTGFLLRAEGDTFVARLAISCCAADARPLKVRVTGDVPSLPDEQWVEVTGQVVPKSASEKNSWVPSFTVESFTPVPEPVEPYES